MHERMTRSELWKAVRKRDLRWKSASSRQKAERVEGSVPSPAFEVTLKADDGTEHRAVVVKALTATEDQQLTRHGAYGQAEPVRTLTSKIVPGGLRVSTIGGTTSLDTNGLGFATLPDGTQLKLQLSSSLKVKVTAAGPLSLTQLSDQQLGMLVRDAIKADAQLAQTMLDLADVNREWLV